MNINKINKLHEFILKLIIIIKCEDDNVKTYYLLIKLHGYFLVVNVC